jgi:predicted dehydrogenase
MENKKTINWALVGTGGISNAFVEGLHSVEGAVLYAVASRSLKQAEEFAQKYAVLKAFGDYDLMLQDKEIDIVYIGIPHAYHKDYALKAFAAGKSVMCEKPLALCAKDVEEMIAAARKNNVFFMEAMWARFVPAMVQAKKWIEEGRIGEPRQVQANAGWKCAPLSAKGSLHNSTDRMWLPEDGGGVLVDCGIYPIALASMVFGNKGQAKTESIKSIETLNEDGIDTETSALVSWGRNKVFAIHTSLTMNILNDGWIFGTDGFIHFPSCIFVQEAALHENGRDPVIFQKTGEKGWGRGNGYNYIAEAAMEDLRAGRLENSIYPLAESLAIARIMDDIRHQNGFYYASER